MFLVLEKPSKDFSVEEKTIVITYSASIQIAQSGHNGTIVFESQYYVFSEPH